MNYISVLENQPKKIWSNVNFDSKDKRYLLIITGLTRPCLIDICFTLNDFY